MKKLIIGILILSASAAWAESSFIQQSDGTVIKQETVDPIAELKTSQEKSEAIAQRIALLQAQIDDLQKAKQDVDNDILTLTPMIPEATVEVTP